MQLIFLQIQLEKALEKGGKYKYGNRSLRHCQQIIQSFPIELRFDKPASNTTCRVPSALRYDDPLEHLFFNKTSKTTVQQVLTRIEDCAHSGDCLTKQVDISV